MRWKDPFKEAENISLNCTNNLFGKVITRLTHLVLIGIPCRRISVYPEVGVYSFLFSPDQRETVLDLIRPSSNRHQVYLGLRGFLFSPASARIMKITRTPPLPRTGFRNYRIRAAVSLSPMFAQFYSLFLLNTWLEYESTARTRTVATRIWSSLCGGP